MVRFKSNLCSLSRQASARPEQRMISTFLANGATRSAVPTTPVDRFFIQQPSRLFQTEADYHTVADETLEDIQDAIEIALEDKGVPEFEVTYASGVLTVAMPPHGTWVLNKQTPNRQIWWSSPITGPRRYEYNGGEWVFTRDESQSTTLVQTLKDEVEEIYQIDLDL